MVETVSRGRKRSANNMGLDAAARYSAERIAELRTRIQTLEAENGRLRDGPKHAAKFIELLERMGVTSSVGVSAKLWLSRVEQSGPQPVIETAVDEAEPFGLPWSVGPHGTDIWCPSLRGGETKPIDIRGWGYLTGQGHGALGLTEQEAFAVQRNLAERIVRAVNDDGTLRTKLSTVEAETIERCAKVAHLVWFEKVQAANKSEYGMPDGYRAEGACEASGQITKAIRALAKPQGERT